MGRILASAIGIMAAAVGAVPAAQVQTPSALVLETTGASGTGLQPYSEVLLDKQRDSAIPLDKEVSLPRFGKLVFLHYKTCNKVAVVGGTITFREDAYTILGARDLEVAAGSCPRMVTLKAGGELAGTLLRPGVMTLSIQPTFVVIGKRASEVASARVSRGGKEVLEAPVEGRRFRWPNGATPLSSNTEYELTLVPMAAGMTPFSKMKFWATSFSTDSAGELPTLIKIE